MGNGDASEREVVNRLEDEMDWRALRAPSSGSATERERPDVLAGRNGRTVVFEVKKSSGDPIYIGHEEVEALREYGEDFGCDPADVRLAIRWKSLSLQDATIYCPKPGDLHHTEKYLRVKYEDCKGDSFPTLVDLCE